MMSIGHISAHLPVAIERNERIVRAGFWRKLRRLIGRLPFAQDLVGAYFCAVDPATPLMARAVLMAAVAYFVLPIDAVPDFLAVLGFGDDAAVLAAAIGTAGAHMMPAHREAARDALLVGRA
jgi:uncharacterized membrane protein YkvA (DUF1232 family)